jgi:hypothetical protein
MCHVLLFTKAKYFASIAAFQFLSLIASLILLARFTGGCKETILHNTISIYLFFPDAALV